MARWLLLRLVRAAIAAGALEDAERWARAWPRASRTRAAAGRRLRAATARAEVLLARDAAAGAAAVARSGALGERAPIASAPRCDALEARLLAGRALAAAGDAGGRDALQRVAADAGPPARCGCATPPGASCGASARASRPTAGAPRGATGR